MPAWVKLNSVQVPLFDCLPNEIVQWCTELQFVIQFSNDAQDGGTISLMFKTLKLTVDQAGFFRKTKKVLVQGDYQGFNKIQITVSGTMATKKRKR